MDVRTPPAAPEEVRYSGRVRDAIRIGEEVREALASGRGVVALETSVVAHGLPRPEGLEAARGCAAAVREGGAIPAAVAVLDGRLVVGATVEEVARLAEPGAEVAKAGARDLAPLLARGGRAGTTVSATCAAAALAGIRLFATGGIGGVHRAPPGAPPSRDVSADLEEMARAPVCVVSAGPKAVLDVAATAEALETLGVPVVGWRTSVLPAFWSADAGVPLAHRVEGPEEAAELLAVHWHGLRRPGGVLLAVPPPWPLPRDAVEEVIARAVAEADDRGIGGAALTPFLLDAVVRATGGRSLGANLALLVENARVAAAVAVAWAGRTA
jgi:pseudouridine-5'-phosphate glycosidase